MCGICGYYSKNKLSGTASSIIQEIVKLQHRRGPDSHGLLQTDHLMLGHNRLSIIDLTPSGHQPMETDKSVIVFNGEVYNYIEIKEVLIEEGINFVGTSDTEVFLKAIEYYGIDRALEMANGMFAFAFYNKETKDLILGRDRLGIKPLYYYLDDDRIVFASNVGAIIKSMYQYENKEWLLNRDSVYKFLLLGGCFEGETLVKNIHKLDSATYYQLNFFTGIQKKKRYWIPEPRYESIDTLIANSIQIRQRADVPVSIFFSGGIDSSILAYYSPGYNGIHLCSDETVYAKEIADKLDINLECIDDEIDEMTQIEMEEMIMKCIDFSGEPGMAVVIPMITSKKMSTISKVGLSGNGGDELFYGYRRTPVRNRKISENVEKIWSIMLRTDIHPPDTYSEEEYQLLHIYRHPDSIKMNGLSREYNLEWLKEYQKENTRLSSKFSNESKYRWLEFCSYVRDDLNPNLDFSSMYYSLEIRVPFLDYRVIERALTMKSEEHIYLDPRLDYPNDRKKVLKDILANKLEERLYNRKKRGFSLPAKLGQYFNNISQNSIHKLIKRGLIEEIQFDIGNIKRDPVYLNTSCCALEKWMKLYVDTGYVVDEYNRMSKEKKIKKYHEEGGYNFDYKLEEFTNYELDMKLSNVENEDLQLLVISDGRILFSDSISNHLHDDKYIRIYFYTWESGEITVSVINNGDIRESSLEIDDIDIYKSVIFKELHHLLMLGWYLDSNEPLRNYRCIIPNQDKMYVLFKIEEHCDDINHLFGFKRHGYLSWKFHDEGSCSTPGILVSETRMDPDKWYLICAAGFEDYQQQSRAYLYAGRDGKNILWKRDEEYQLKKSLSLVSEIIKGGNVQYGVLFSKLNKESEDFYLSKLTHLEVEPSNYQIDCSYTFQKKWKVMIVIAFLGRHQILRESMKLFSKQTMIPGVVLVGSTEEDTAFCREMSTEYENVFYLRCPNNPVGLKWKAGVSFSRLFNPEAILIVGSDDVISLDYVRRFYNLMKQGYDMIGKRVWHIVNNLDGGLYRVNYTDKVDITLGAGRMYSRRILDRFNWDAFEFLRDRCLDDLGFHMVEKMGGKVYVDDDDEIQVLSVKGSWATMNSFEKIVEASQKEGATIGMERLSDEKIDEWFRKHMGEDEELRSL